MIITSIKQTATVVAHRFLAKLRLSAEAFILKIVFFYVVAK